MTMLSSEYAICKNCGSQQLYTKVLSWNTWLDPEYPANNKCSNCGCEITYDDIDMSKCTPSHREEVRLDKIYERMSAKENKDKVSIICPECGSDNNSYVYNYVRLPDKYKDKDNYLVYSFYYKCKECGCKIYETIEKILSSGFYEFIENGEKEHEYIVKRVDNYKEIIAEANRKMKEELDKTEKELIAEGLITTREEEKEYENKYNEQHKKKWKV